MGVQTRKFKLTTVLICAALTIVILAVTYPLIESLLPKRGPSNPSPICLSNIMRLSMAMELYTSDFDGRYPLSMPPDFSQNRWRTLDTYSPDNLIEFPVGWRKSQSEDRYVENLLGWPNAIYPYINNVGTYVCLQSDRLRRTKLLRGEGGEISDYSQQSATGQKPALVSYTYNGLLHTYSFNQINDPLECFLLWEGTGKVQVEGFAISNPLMRCQKLTEPCIYVPYSRVGNCPITNSRSPSATLLGTSRTSLMPGGSMFVHTSGIHVAFADTHAKWIRIGSFTSQSRIDPQELAQSPFTLLDEAGFPIEFATDGCWPSRFRPDNQGRYSDRPR